MAKGKPPEGMEEIPYREGHWIDWTDPAGICIRDAAGRLVARDLHITRADAEKVRREYRALLAEEVAKAKREHD